MALLDTLNDITRNAIATRNRVDILLDTLAGSEDGDTLTTALRSNGISSASLTKALRKEYGQAIVTDTSVDAWRRKNSTDLTGL